MTTTPQLLAAIVTALRATDTKAGELADAEYQGLAEAALSAVADDLRAEGERHMYLRAAAATKWPETPEPYAVWRSMTPEQRAYVGRYGRDAVVALIPQPSAGQAFTAEQWEMAGRLARVDATKLFQTR